MLKFSLIFFLFSCINIITAENKYQPDSLAYKSIPSKIKKIIINKCKIDSQAMDSLYFSGLIDLKYVYISDKAGSCYLVRFVDTNSRIFIFTYYYDLKSYPVKQVTATRYELRESGKAYYITGFDSVHLFERKELINYLKESGFMKIYDLYTHILISNFTFKLFSSEFRNDSYTLKKVRKSKIRYFNTTY